MLIAQGGANPIELSTNGVVRVYIKDDGNVGIGTTGPTQKLTVAGNTDITGILYTNTINRYHNSEININSGNYNINLTANTDGNDNDGLTMTVGAAERMRIGSNGNVGIGTVAPTSKLQVVGLPTYANNAAALTGGLTAGAFYRTGGDPDPVCVVH